MFLTLCYLIEAESYKNLGRSINKTFESEVQLLAFLELLEYRIILQRLIPTYVELSNMQIFNFFQLSIKLLHINFCCFKRLILPFQELRKVLFPEERTKINRQRPLKRQLLLLFQLNPTLKRIIFFNFHLISFFFFFRPEILEKISYLGSKRIDCLFFVYF